MTGDKTNVWLCRKSNLLPRNLLCEFPTLPTWKQDWLVIGNTAVYDGLLTGADHDEGQLNVRVRGWQAHFLLLHLVSLNQAFKWDLLQILRYVSILSKQPNLYSTQALNSWELEGQYYWIQPSYKHHVYYSAKPLKQHNF